MISQSVYQLCRLIQLLTLLATFGGYYVKNNIPDGFPIAIGFEIGKDKCFAKNGSQLLLSRLVEHSRRYWANGLLFYHQS